jgi:hypothetical protein
MRSKRLTILALLLLAVVGCTESPPDTCIQTHEIKLEPWPEADSLFRGDPLWLGGDDAYSIDLGRGRVLWLFGDSFVATSGARSRRRATMVRNSVAIQQGYDPSTASMQFYWREADGAPGSFFAPPGASWFWPGHGIQLDGTLIVFLMKIRTTSDGQWFEVFDWTAVRVANPDADPSQWELEWLAVPSNNFGVIVGSASVLQIDQHVYAFGAREPDVHDVYVVRWPASDVIAGNLSEPYWWAGDASGWVPQSSLTQLPPPVLEQAQTEFTVHLEPAAGEFLQVQTIGFGAATLGVRWSSSLTGPWSCLQSIYEPLEARRSDALIYAGKAHPELLGADVVLTYVVNSTDFGRLVDDDWIYYPRFLRGTIN